MSNKVRIYCVDPGPRHDYIFSLIFERLLGADFIYADSTASAHLNYSAETSTQLSCIPHGLLKESTLRESIKEEVSFAPWGETHCFFKTGEGRLPFDIFSAAFYLVSRYEEWLAYKPDGHNRFPAEESVLTQNNLLDEPLVNQWAIELKRVLCEQDPNLVFEDSEFSYLSTIDIDQAWKYKNKGIVRNSLGAFRDLISGKWGDLKERFMVLSSRIQDPFQTFEWQITKHKELDIPCLYFILLGDRGEYDKNISHTNDEFIKLIQNLAKQENTSIGIHPSYDSNENAHSVNEEISRLTKITGSRPTHSRQHFLMHTMPTTYRNLIKNNIQIDYTMGYSTHLGFRAGIASSFLWFDLEKNEQTDLLLVPFCAMDITPLHYMKQTEQEAIVTLCKLVDKVKHVNGCYLSLWHNDSLSKDGRWRGWRRVYEEVIEYIRR